MSLFNIFKPIRSRVRRFIRQRTLPMSVDEAMEKREFFAKVYLLTTFSLFSYFLYRAFNIKTASFDPNVSVPEATIENLRIEGKTRIIKFKGFEKVEDYFYERKEENEKNEDVNPDVELLVETVPEMEAGIS